jgi:hypothetical protein
MTEVQLERAANRLVTSTRAGGKTDFATGKSDHVMDASLVADAYLREFVRYRDAHDIIHRGAELLREVPITPQDVQALKQADETLAFFRTRVTDGSPNLQQMLAGYEIARTQMGRLQAERPCVDLTTLKMHPSIQLASGPTTISSIRTPRRFRSATSPPACRASAATPVNSRSTRTTSTASASTRSWRARTATRSAILSRRCCTTASRAS